MAAHKTLIILQRASRKIYLRAYQCIWDNYIIFAQKYYNFTTLSIWVVYTSLVSKSAIVPKYMIFYLLWYNVMRWNGHVYKKSCFLSFHSLLFLVNKVKLTLSKWHTFWMVPLLICCFIVIFLYIERKWLLKRNLATILPLKSKLSEKFSVSMLLMEVSEYWKIVKFPVI